MGGDDKVMGQGPFGASYYLKGALAGGICCSLTHGNPSLLAFCLLPTTSFNSSPLLKPYAKYLYLEVSCVLSSLPLTLSLFSLNATKVLAKPVI